MNIYKKLVVLSTFIGFSIIAQAQNGVVISDNNTSTPDASAKLDVQSITQGMLVPRMTSVQRTGITNPAKGLLVFDIITGSFWYNNTEDIHDWIELGGAGSTGSGSAVWEAGPVGNSSIRAINTTGLDATGDYAVAEGDATLASGYASHAEGASTTADGSYSHAEGTETISSGGASHAEGYLTVAFGDLSHAEGYFTIAQGLSSHAEGYFTLAEGLSSHAEGGNTEAISEYSHAEGNYTVAEGNGSHAEGLFTAAEGNGAHIGGSGFSLASPIIASGEGSFAHFVSTIDFKLNPRHAFGVIAADYSAILGGTDHRIRYESAKSGIICGDSNLIEGGFSSAIIGGYRNYIDRASYSAIIGGTTNSFIYNNTITNSVILGGIDLIGDKPNYAFAENVEIQNGLAFYNDVAPNTGHAGTSGNNNAAIDAATDNVLITKGWANANLGAGGGSSLWLLGSTGISSSLRANTGSDATASRALAIGYNTTASGTSSHSEGYGTLASGNNSHSEGYNTTASGINSHSEGRETLSEGMGSHAEGDDTHAEGAYSHSEGVDTHAEGVYSHSEGVYTRTIGVASHAGGNGQPSNYIVAGGYASFVHFGLTSSLANKGAYADYSAILGGLHHSISAGATSSAILGGNTNTINANITNSAIIAGENIIADKSNTAYTENLEVKGTMFLVPKMITADRLALSGIDLVEGMIVYDETLHKHFGYNGTNWNALY